MGIGFCVLKGLFRMRKRGVYGISWIKRGNIGLGEFMEMALSITLGKNILVVCDVFVVNGMRYILIYIFLNNPDDNNNMMMSTFSGLTVPVGQKEMEKDDEWEDSQVQLS